MNIKIKNSSPYSSYNNPGEFDNLTKQQQTVLKIWIDECLKPFETKRYNHHPITSYGLKHRFERSNVGFYVTNGQFKGAMLESGFEPKDHNTLNWTFKLGKRAGAKRNISSETLQKFFNDGNKNPLRTCVL